MQGINPSLRSKSFHKLPSLVEKIDHFNQINITVSFLAIVETWLKGHITDAQLYIKDYNIYRCDRATSKNGGVMLYIHTSIIIDTCSVFDNDSCCAVACMSKSSNCIICCVYRPPNASDEDFYDLVNFINNFLTFHNSSDKLQTFIFGDFNFPHLSWNCDEITDYKSISEICLKEFSDNHFFTQYINENTRKNNLLDLFLTNDPNFVQHINVNDVHFSDHRLVEIFTPFFSNNLDTDKNHTNNSVQNDELDFSKFNLNSTNFNELNLDLSSINWEDALSGSIEDIPHKFNKIIFSALSKHTNLFKEHNLKFKNRYQRERYIINRKIRKLKMRSLNPNHNDFKRKELL